RLQNAVQTPPSGLARHAWPLIIPGRLPHSVKPSPEFCSGNSRVVLFVELPFYNTVVLRTFLRQFACCIPPTFMRPVLEFELLPHPLRNRSYDRHNPTPVSWNVDHFRRALFHLPVNLLRHAL